MASVDFEEKNIFPFEDLDALGMAEFPLKSGGF
jgi:hypothetical protein